MFGIARYASGVGRVTTPVNLLPKCSTKWNWGTQIAAGASHAECHRINGPVHSGENVDRLEVYAAAILNDYRWETIIAEARDGEIFLGPAGRFRCLGEDPEVEFEIWKAALIQVAAGFGLRAWQDGRDIFLEELPRPAL